MAATTRCGVALAGLGLALCAAWLRGDRAAEAAAPLETSFFAQAQQQIAAREYQASETPDGLQAPNRRHGLRTWFEPDGIRVHDRTASGSPRLVELSLDRVGRGDALAEVAPGEVANVAERVEIRRPGLVEWYVNSPDGVEQGFTFETRPAAEAPGELVLELAADGANAALRGDDVALATTAGRTLRYGALAAYDASGRALPSAFEVAATDRVRLVVDDRDALYPVVVDPLLTETADAQIESNQADANLGFSVASAGDVNRDGYADVIVGARLYDNGQTDEGAAFVRLGSVSGIAPGPGTLVESNQASANFGRSVASAGDVNGDGYGDVIVGAHVYDAGQADEGAAFVFLGSAAGIVGTNPTNAHARLESNEASAQLGISVASAGDVNGDGYGDVIVGANLYGEPNEGAAFVFLGSAAGIANGNPSTAHSRLVGDQANAEMGISVASAGDVNADGYDDVLVGAALYDHGQTDEGAAFVFLGSVSGITAVGNPGNAQRELQSDQSGAWMGRSVASAGDVNGDGYGDVIIGAPLYDGSETDEGAAFVFRGSASGISLSSVAQIEADLAFSELGVSVASAGDVNGDGYADVIVGATFYAAGSTDEGAAFVFLGSAFGVGNGRPATAYAHLEPNQASARMGLSVAGAGDVNGDGYADVIVGVHLHNAGESNEGVAFVYHGSSAGIEDGTVDNAHVRIRALQTDVLIGASVASAGDVNGDGYNDILVGAPRYDAGQPNEGVAFLFLGSASGIDGNNPGSADAQLQGSQMDALFGYSVASAGDVNGDGYDDVIVGALQYDSGPVGEGAAFVFLGSSFGLLGFNPSNAHARLLADQSDSRMGIGVASAGDVNGDGYADVIVGASFYNAGQSNEGAAFVFLGSAAGIAHGGPATAHARLEGDQADAWMGASVASAGDVNGDGYADVIVGAYHYESGQADEGAAFLFLGSSTGIADASPLTAAADFASNQAGAQMGRSVASAGDVNGDGYADVIVGAHLYDGGQTDEGAAFVFHGGPSGIADGDPGTANSQLEADQASASLGVSVAGAGDVNGDGFADVIVGSPQYGYVGAAHLFLGSAAGIPDGSPATAYAQIDGDVSGNSLLGSSVASAGDVNADGFADVIVGAPEYPNPFDPQQGSAYVFLGNSNFPRNELGRPVLARQRRGDGSGIPVSPWGLSESQDGFAAELRATHPAGKGRVRAQFEACAAGDVFGDAGCTTGLSAWTPVGGATPEVLLAQTLSGLDPDTLYRWRARIQHASATGPLPSNPGHGPWRRLGAQSREGDIRIPEPSATASLAAGIVALVWLRRRRGRATR